MRSLIHIVAVASLIYGRISSLYDQKSIKKVFSCSRQISVILLCFLKILLYVFVGFTVAQCQETPQQFVAGCFDSNMNCGFWGSKGECTANPNWMLPNCRLTCNQCRPPPPSPQPLQPQGIEQTIDEGVTERGG